MTVTYIDKHNIIVPALGDNMEYTALLVDLCRWIIVETK
jgi:hypothetical protein